MTTVFRSAAQWLQDKRLAHAVVDITYERGALSEAMEAQIGVTKYEEMDNEGAAFLRFESRDFIIDISEFEGTIAGPPQTGDIITEIQDGTTYKYRVAVLGSHYSGRDAAQHYRRDAHRLTYRVHTKRMTDN